MNNFIRYYIVPGAVIQSSVVAGGYGTGREVMEFVTRHGAWGGIVASLTAGLVFAIVIALTWELARLSRTYDYHNFTKVLLGPAWISYEMLFIASMFVVQAVIAAAAGKVLSDLLPVEPWVGVILMLVVIVVLNYFGRAVVVACMGVTAILVTLVLILFTVLAVAQQPETIANMFAASDPVGVSAMASGATFAMYNCLAIPVLLYVVIGQENRRQSFVSGLLAGLFAVIPAFLLHFAFLGNGGDLMEYPLPTYWMLKLIDIQWVTAVYLIVLFATVVQSGVGVLHGLNERVDATLVKIRGKGLSKISHAMIAGGVIAASGLLAQIGVVDLIKTGYSFIAFGLFAVYLAPLITVGAYRVFVSKA